MNSLEILEFNLIKNCNLNCKGCNHFSTITNHREVLSVETVKRDLERLKELNIEIKKVSLLGGEPLLLNNLEEYIKVCKKVYPNSKVFITTNGLLVCEMSKKLQKALKEHNVILLISLYPILKREKLKKKISKFLRTNNINYRFIVYKNKFRKQLTTEPYIKDLKKYCLCGTPTMENGKLYCCPVSTFIYKINEKYGYDFPDNEYIDIYDKKVDVDKICNIKKSTIELCKYCSPKNISTFKWQGYCSNSAKASDWVMRKDEKRNPSYHLKRKIFLKINKIKNKIVKK